MGTKTLVLVGCGSKKRDERCPAHQMYTSNYANRKFATACFLGVPAIASAKHELLWPHEIIDPYEETLNGESYEDRLAWARRLRAQIPNRYEKLCLLMGREYAEPILEVCCGDYKINDPFKHTSGLHEQHDWMNEILDEYAPE